jgi:4-hydroxyphenylpyruvate dioxygenase-like putative hemolysin
MSASPRSPVAEPVQPAEPAQSTQSESDFLPLKGTDHIEFYVGNARQAAYFYRTAFGMSLVAYAGPETGQRDRASYVVQQGKIRFVLTTPLRSGDAIADHVHRHGDAALTPAHSCPASAPSTPTPSPVPPACSTSITWLATWAGTR